MVSLTGRKDMLYIAQKVTEDRVVRLVMSAKLKFPTNMQFVAQVLFKICKLMENSYFLYPL